MKNFALLLLLSMTVAACGGMNRAINSTNSMPGKMDDMIRKTDHLNEIVDLQAVILPFEAMLKEEYGRDLIPIPFDLMPFAKKFAQYTSAEEIPELVYVWMKKLNEVTIDANGTPEPVDQFNRRKMQTLAALQAVCGFLPQEKVQKIIEQQIYSNGRYQTATLQMLMLRVRFLRDVMLEASLFSEPLDSVGKLEKAIEYNTQIDFIARLPFAGEIGVNITGFVDPFPAVQEVMDPGLALQEWRKIKTKAGRSLKVQPKSLTGDPARDRELYRQQYEAMQRGLNVVDSRIRSWGVQP